MHVTLVHVRVRPERIDAFVQATRVNHEASVREPGNLRFDVLQAADDRTRFLLYEAYVDEAAAEAHKQTPHYLEWREAVADWMAEPRRGEPFIGLFPDAPRTMMRCGAGIPGGATGRSPVWINIRARRWGS